MESRLGSRCGLGGTDPFALVHGSLRCTDQLCVRVGGSQPGCGLCSCGRVGGCRRRRYEGSEMQGIEVEVARRLLTRGRALRYAQER